MAKNEIEEIKNSQLMVFDDIESDGDGGFGEVNSSDFVIPRIALIGDLSPQKRKNDAKYINGVETGDIVDAGLGVLLAKGYQSNDKKPIHVVPVRRIREAIEWRPRNSGGGIINREILGSKDFKDIASSRGAHYDEMIKAWKLPNGNTLIDTWQLYVIDIERGMPCFIPMKNSNIKMIKPWFTARRQFKFPRGHKAAGQIVPLYAKTLYLSSFEDTDGTNAWPNWTLSDGVPTMSLESGSDLIAAAKELNAILSEGSFVAELKDDESTSDDIPF